ncbi:MAG: cytochrome c3 family protein [Candidatus Zixiibacteriota bacterium]
MITTRLTSARTVRRRELTAHTVTIVLITLLSLPLKGEEPAVDDGSCLSCHEEYDAGLARTAHALGPTGSGKVWCVSCHEGGQIHLEDPTKDNITNPSRMVGAEARAVCSACHDAHKQLDDSGFDVHSQQQLNCASCHKVHGGSAALLLSDRAEFCRPCHEDVVGSMHRRSQHPVNQRAVTCLSCHSFVKRSDHGVAYDQARVCQSCHPVQSGPFPYEHPATSASLVEGGSCLECHAPHSSENDRLLRQPGAALCRQCHVEPPGHRNLPALHGFVRDIEDCFACHTGVHGSMTSHKLLDPMLQARLGSPQDCTQCHEL